jgi:3-oxoacyl-[acyl-carrier protein] reductase
MAEVAIVTGGTGGIGTAICARLASSGYVVLAGDIAGVERRDGPPGLAGPGEVVPWPMDVTSDESVGQAVAAAVTLGSIGAVVNCAGIVRDTPADTMPPEKFLPMFDVNVHGAARVVHASLPYLLEGSSIVQIGSIAGAIGRYPRISMYSATKAGLEGFTRVLACELASRGIRVNCVAPGFIVAPFSPDWEEISGGNEALAKLVPLGRLGTADEIAEVVEFLVSPRASYITGTTVRVDGGVGAW